MVDHAYKYKFTYNDIHIYYIYDITFITFGYIGEDSVTINPVRMSEQLIHQTIENGSVDVDVVVALEHKASAGTEGSDPVQQRDALARQIRVRVDDVHLDQIGVLAVLSLDAPLHSTVVAPTNQKNVS